MNTILSTLRQLGAAVLGKRPASKEQHPPSVVAQKPAVDAFVELAPTIESFLLDAYRLLATAGASTVLSSYGVTLSDWLLLRELRASPSSLRSARRHLLLHRSVIRQQLQRLLKLNLASVRTIGVGEIEEQRFEPSTKGIELLKAFAAELESTGVAGSVGYRRTTKIMNALQRALRNLPR